MKDLNDLLRSVLAARIFQDRKSPLRNRVHLLNEGTVKSNLTVVLGDNSSGKSLFRRELQDVCNEHDIETLDVSMELRSQDPFVRSERYGDEEVMSTGLLSVSALSRLLTASKEEKRKHVLILDEPDVGVSDEVAAGMALDIRDYLAKPSAKLLGVFLVTHRRTLLNYLTLASPRVVFLGSEAPSSLRAWLDRLIQPRRPRELIEAGVNLWNDVSEFQAKKR